MIDASLLLMERQAQARIAGAELERGVGLGRNGAQVQGNEGGGALGGGVEAEAP